MADENTKIKVWYHETYPDDDLYTEIKSDFRFYDLFLALDQHKDIYKEMFIDNGGDTIIHTGTVFFKISGNHGR